MAEPDFEDQLRQEELAAVDDEVDTFNTGRTRVDPDGTVYEWDTEKKAWFPKIDEDFIANYQMNYGSDVTVTTSATAATTTVSNTIVSSEATAANTQPSGSAAQYSTSGHMTTATTDSQAYRDWYNYYYGNAQGSQTSDKADGDKSSEADAGNNSDECSSTQSDIPPAPADTNSEEYYHWYYKYYGSTTESSENTDYWTQYWQYYQEVGEDGNKAPSGDATQTSTETATQKSGTESKPEENKGKGKGKRKPTEPPSWFDVEEQKNTNVYISGLPSDITDDEFKDLMNKCGLIMFDPITRKPKMKLYKDKDGNNKGDGLCCYIKSESVDLALQFLDGSDVRGHTIYVEKAKFEMKGNFDPSKRRRKLTKHEKKKFQQKQEKLFDWRPDKPLGARGKNEKVVILKNAFDVKIFEDPTRINQMRSELQKECTVFGEVKKVVVYDRHPEGVAAITFKDAEMADICIQGMNGRYYANRLVTAETWDGKTKFLIQETEEENKKRLQQWTSYLEGGSADQSQTSAQSGDQPRPKQGTTDTPSQPPGGRSQSPEGRSPSPGGHSQSPGSRSQSPGGQSQSPGGHSQSPGGHSQPQSEGGATEQEVDTEQILPEGEEPIPEGAAASGGETD